MILNAGIKTVVARSTKGNYQIFNVDNWIENDDSLSGEFGY